jgi:hypothetical protein
MIWNWINKRTMRPDQICDIAWLDRYLFDQPSEHQRFRNWVQRTFANSYLGDMIIGGVIKRAGDRIIERLNSEGG